MGALFVARPLFPSEAVASQGDGLLVVMLWIALAVVWLCGAVGRPAFRLRLGWTDAAVVLLIAWHTIAAIWAAMHRSPRPAVNMLWEWIALALAFFLARQLIASRREARAVVVVMVALAVALSGYGLYQYFWELPATRAMYEADAEQAMRELGMPFEPGSPEQHLFESRLQSTEPFATFALANSLAGYLAPWLVVLAGIGLSAPIGTSSLENRAPRHHIGPKVAVWVAVVGGGGLIAFCLLLTKSRSAWMATAVGALLVVVLLVSIVWRELAGRFGRKLGGAGVLAGGLLTAATVVLLAAALITAAVAAGGLDREVLAEASKSLGYRFQYWQSTLRMIADHPVVGCGPGNFQRAYTAYKLPEASEEVADPHNFLLEVWATAGTPALLALLAVLGCFLRVSISPRSHALRGNGIGGRSPPLRGNGPPPEPAQSDVSSQSVPTRSMGPRKGSAGPLAKAEGTSDSPAHVFGGAGCGFLLAWPLGLISAAPPGLAAVLVGLPLAAACAGLLSGWVRRGSLPAVLPAIGVVVLLVHLLAAGGISFPGVAGSLWLLVAVGLSLAGGNRPPRSLPRVAAWGGLVGAVGLAVACYLTGYGPVFRCQGQIRSAGRELADGDLPAAQRHFEAAAKADPLAAAPRHQLAQIAFRTWSMGFKAWQNDPSPEGLRSVEDQYARFEQYNAAALKLAPNSSAAWFDAGQRYWEAYRLSRRQDDIDKAIHAYCRAVELYPNNALYRGKLALAYQAAGHRAAFQQQADEALRLDGLTPHADKKLPEQLRQRLLRKRGRP